MSVNLDPRPGDPFPVTTHLLQKITELEHLMEECEDNRKAYAENNEQLRAENAALHKDKDRLDWLGSVKCAYYHEGPCCWRINEDETTDAETIRAAIDAARKENG